MNYKSGNKVLLKTWGRLVRQYGLDKHTELVINSWIISKIGYDLLIKNNHIATIESCNDGLVCFNENINTAYPNEVIEGLVFNVGEEIEFSTDNNNNTYLNGEKKTKK